MTPLEIILSLSLFAAVVGLIVSRFARYHLQHTIGRQTTRIEVHDAEIAFLADELKAYKGAWLATAPKEGGIHVTRVIRPPVTLNDHIIDMIRKAGGC